ncbi:MAG: cobalamin-dependent protein [Phycisphaerales bacterium]|nr:cobalamin-dependent protein [Phycisphaerales bacterium]
MAHEALVERFFETLITGDRPATRQVVDQARGVLGSPEALVSELFWPTHQMIEKLYRADQLSRMNHHMAVRLMRQLVDQNAARMTFNYTQDKTVLAFCGNAENEELGAQMAVDLLEAGGYRVLFGGAGVAADEIIGRVNDEKPDVLLMFCSSASDLPDIRGIIDTLAEIGAAPGTQIAVGGGVFNRAEGLAEEIGADQWATSPMEMVELLLLEPERRAEQSQRTVGRIRRRAKAA